MLVLVHILPPKRMCSESRDLFKFPRVICPHRSAPAAHAREFDAGWTDADEGMEQRHGDVWTDVSAWQVTVEAGWTRRCRWRRRHLAVASAAMTTNVQSSWPSSGLLQPVIRLGTALQHTGRLSFDKLLNIDVHRGSDIKTGPLVSWSKNILQVSVATCLRCGESVMTTLLQLRITAWCEELLHFLLLARLMGRYCFACWRLLVSSIIVVFNAAGGQVGRRARGRSGGLHCTAGQYGYAPLGRHLV